MTDRERIAEYLRREADRHRAFDISEQVPARRHVDTQVSKALRSAAEAIERYEDYRRPEPTIPASEWAKTPSVGH